MSLVDYRVHDGVDVDLEEPLAGRLERLLARFGGRVLILSGRRTYAEQQALWDRNPDPALTARPGTSNHERGRAADLRIVDPSVTWREVHLAGGTFGLHWPVPREDWHVEADPSFVEEEPDMTPAELKHAIGPTAELGLDGVIRIPLVNDKLDGHEMWSIGEALTFVHQELKMRRISGQ